MTSIKYDAPATLWKEAFGEIASGKLAHLYSREVTPLGRETLRGCLVEFDAKPDSKKGLYSILTNETANLPKTTLYRQDIETLGLRSAL